MNAPVPNSTRYWRWLFLLLETVIVGGMLFGLIAEKALGWRIEPKSQAGWAAFQISMMCIWLFLLIVSPFFLRSLKGVALAGWLIAFGVLVIGALTPRL